MKRSAYLTLFALLIHLISFAQNNPQGFSMLGTNPKSIELNRTFTSSGELFPFQSINSTIFGAAINADVKFSGANGVVRILLLDEDFNQYQIYETFALMEDQASVSVKDICEETTVLDGVKPYSLYVEVENAEVNLKQFKYATGLRRGFDIRTAKQESKQLQLQEKVKRLNANIKAKGLKWIAGATDVAKMTYAERKKLYGQSTFPPGIEYYAGGILSVGESSMLKSASASTPYVPDWDWRNRHGKNWITSIKNQGDCGSCWAFAATGATEAMANLYFNDENLDLDLSEQDVLSCTSANDDCDGGQPFRALDKIRDDGIVDEAAWPYTEIFLPSLCTSEKADASELIRINGRIDYGSTDYPRSVEGLQKMLIELGPISGGIYDWSHAMTLVGYHTVKEGDVFTYSDGTDLYDLHNDIVISAGDPLIGTVLWIFKNSWGNWGDGGYSYFQVDPLNIGWTHGITTPIISEMVSREVQVVDNDGDGYYWWGIGEKPAGAPGPELADGDDSNPNLGPLDEYGYCTVLDDYNVYYGHLHNHSNVSDGTGTPNDAYNYAKNTAGLDFFSLSDHAYLINSTEWETIKNTAESYNEDGVFTSFWGFEWSHSTQGHVTVINTEDYCTTGTEPNFSDLLSWINSHDCAAFFNHPGRQNSNGQEFGQFLDTPSEKFVGMELWNKADVFDVYYYNDGYYSSDGNLSYFDEALTRDWKIGAGGSEDNHTSDWGTRTDNRLAVLSNALTRSAIYDALQNKRFFTTLDKNLKMSFRINGMEMGSTIQGESGQSLHVSVSDDDGETFSKIELYKNGILETTWNPGVSDVDISDYLSTSDGDYYYIKVTQPDGDEAISSPIFIEGGISNVSPVCVITNPEDGQYFSLTQSIILSADAADSDGTISQVEFFVDDVSVGIDYTSPYEITWTIPTNGAYTITAKASDDLGAMTSSDPVNITVGTFTKTVAVRIASSNDDVEEGQNGAIYTTSTDLELIYDTYNDQFLQTVGLHFSNLNIPQGATISSASIQFTVDEASAGTVNLTISGDASDDSPAFTSSMNDLSNRIKTLNTVNWSPPDWNTVNEADVNQRTPDLSPVIQEIVDRPGFSTASAISLFITGIETNKRVAVAYDGVPASAAVLNIEYTVGDGNIPPVAAFTYDANYLTVNFSDESSDTDGTIAAWLWDFGDGSTSTIQYPTHSYASSGTYTVNLIVTDNDNASDNTAQQFTVNCLDTDSDGVCDANDDEINSPCPDYVDEFGVSVDSDNDGVADCQDGCPDDVNKTTPGACGCGIPDTDSDSDGVSDCNDGCPQDPLKTAPGDCGCGVPDTDSDGDGVADCNDQEENSPCPGDVDEYGVSFDSDADGVADCLDQEINSPCPEYVDEYGVSFDTDSDGIADCNDGCPDDSDKVAPGDCGCGVAETDTDNDGLADCIDGCPEDPNKTETGDCGCGVADTDSDNDGISDCIDPCIAQTTSFINNSLSHTGTGSNSTTLFFPDNSQDVSFTISNINEKTRPTSKNFDEWITVDYNNGFGNNLLGTYFGVSSVFIEIPGTVVSVSVSLTDGGDGDSGSSTMSVSFSTVDFCIANVEPCDDDDKDGICNEFDQCEGFDDNLDEDSDGIPDGCDLCNDLIDSDEDGVSDCVDVEIPSPCPDNVDENGVSLDNDGDGICDDIDKCPGFDDNIDTDGDGVPDGCDICKDFDDTVDTDGDGIPDGCDDCPNDPDNDADGDGVCGDIDNCPNTANADQLDSNGDGIGDACEASDYCIPEEMVITGDFIQAVTIGSFSETFELGTGYQYYTDHIVLLSAGTNDVVLTPYNSKNRNYWKIWIDSNYDGVFDDLTETVLSIPSKKGAVLAQIAIPAITENTRMRISMRNQALPLPCDNSFEGDVKDFELSVAASTKSASLKPLTPLAEELSLKVYPNPFDDEINIQISGTGDYEKASVHIYNIAGKLVYNEVYGKQHSITIQDLHLKPGCYFITVQLDDWTKTEQLIKTQ